jgi:outer membrane protein TolC
MPPQPTSFGSRPKHPASSSAIASGPTFHGTGLPCRSARVDGANAAIAQSSANIDEVTRTVLRLAASAYYRAVHANDRIRLLIATQEVAQSVTDLDRTASLRSRRSSA